MTDSHHDTPFFYDLDHPQLMNTLLSWGEPSYREKQIWQGIYQQFWENPSDFSNIPGNLRVQLQESFVYSKLKPVKTLESSDGNTTKVLFGLGDLPGIETVLMRYNDRNTICVSTQVGCSMGCAFCATGQMGFQKNLSSGEIIEQVLFFTRLLKKNDQKITNIVMMGMGEPFYNYKRVMAAIDRLNDSQGFNFGERRMTISTVGVIPMIRRFTQEKRQVNLAVSLHSANNETRSKLLPANLEYPLNELMIACKDYVETTGRRISFEWALINEINDHPEDARQLGRLLKGMLAHVNIIPLNPIKGYAGTGSEEKRLKAFCKELIKMNIAHTVRLRRGIDIEAGCGQLATGMKTV